MKLRTFLGISLSEEVRENLEHWTQAVQVSIQGVRWVPAEQMHVTLHFLGELDTATLADVERLVAPLIETIAPSHLEVGGVGIFKSVRHPRTLWAGLQGEITTLSQLHAEIATALRVLPHVPQVQEKFSPHITLARVGRQQHPRGLEHFLKRGNDKHFGEFALEAVTLFKSKLTREGARYSTISRFELGG